MADGKNLTSTADKWHNAAEKAAKPKMDLPKALSLMGFSNPTVLDVRAGRDIKEELNKALTRQMDIIDRKRAKAEEAEKAKAKTKKAVVSKPAGYSGKREMDEVLCLHEAYQFLSMKYMNDKIKYEKKQHRLLAQLENEQEDDVDDDNQSKDDGGVSKDED